VASELQQPQDVVYIERDFISSFLKKREAKMFEWLMNLANETLGLIEDSFYNLEQWIKRIAAKLKKGEKV